MGFGNSNNWQTEAALRNERLAKQTSLDKLLEHVNWDAETLTLSLNGITLSWGDITGADNVAMKSDIPTDAHITQITENTISTAYIVADSVAADHITNATLWGNQYGFSFDTTDGFKVGYVGNTEDYTADLTVGYDANGAFGTVEINSHVITLSANRQINMFATSGVTINGEEVIVNAVLTQVLSSYYKSGSTATLYKLYITSPGAISEDNSVLRYYSPNGQVCTTSSSRRWKRDIENVSDESLDPHKLYEVPIRQFRYNEGTLVDGKDDVLRIGFIAEELEEIYPLATCHDRDGLVSDWNDRALIPAMLKLIQEQHNEIETLKERING